MSKTSAKTLLVFFLLFFICNINAQYKKKELKKLSAIKNSIESKNFDAFKIAFNKMYSKNKNFLYNKDFENETILNHLIGKGMPYFTEHVLNNGYNIWKERWRSKQSAINKAKENKRLNEERVSYVLTLKDDFKRTSLNNRITSKLLSKRNKMVKPLKKGSRELRKIDSLWLHSFFDYCEKLKLHQSLDEMMMLLKISRAYKHKILSDNKDLSLLLFKTRGLPLYQKHFETTVTRFLSGNPSEKLALLRQYTNLIMAIESMNQRAPWRFLEREKYKKNPDLTEFATLFNSKKNELITALSLKICRIEQAENLKGELDKKISSIKSSTTINDYYKSERILGDLYNSYKLREPKSCMVKPKQIITTIDEYNQERSKNVYALKRKIDLKKYGMFLETQSFDNEKVYVRDLHRMYYEGKFKNGIIYTSYDASTVTEDNFTKLAMIYHVMLSTSKQCTTGILHQKQTQIMRDVCIQNKVTKDQNGREISRACSKTKEVPTGLYTSKRMYAAYKNQKAKTNSISGIWDGLKSIANQTVYSKKGYIKSLNNDFDNLLKLNGCNSKALHRLEENYIRYLNNEVSLKLIEK